MRPTFQSLANRNPRPRHSVLLFYWDLSSWFERKMPSQYSHHVIPQSMVGDHKKTLVPPLCVSLCIQCTYMNINVRSISPHFLRQYLLLNQELYWLSSEPQGDRSHCLHLSTMRIIAASPHLWALGYYGLNSGSSVWATITLLSEPSSQWL